MEPPSFPPDEQVRLETLQSIGILDTPPEERFDRVTRIAKRLFRVPSALVTLIDSDRQWFKSSTGSTRLRETPRAISFCGHTILGDEVLIVPDAKKDQRFRDNPLVVGEPTIRFYAGCPLKAPNGQKMGTLCIIDTKPRGFTEADVESLKDLAAIVEAELMAVQLATSDQLTSISNRRGFIGLAQNSLNICARQKIPASLVFMDLDKFKILNDNFGHLAGDRALSLFAGQMEKTYRSSDILGRLGGDEFAVLLVNTDKEDAESFVS
ncbi:MAG: sensor domain-containing diguanylate cyclase, partial [Oleiphilaceae bacterium]|nr:sensor domain-containing diguanylate cyclase [Oleiphilaceae bacterium]